MSQEHVRLKALEMKSFRSWKAPVRFEFPSTGLTLLRGPGSGSGKSSVALGIADALGICTIPATRLVTWGESRREVAVEVSKGDDTLRVERTSGAKLVVNGEEKKGAPKYLNEQLAQFLGVRELEWLKPLTYRAQRSRSFFLTLTDAEKKAFLAPICGLDLVEKALEESEQAASALGEAEFRALGEKAGAWAALNSLPQHPFDPGALAEAVAGVEAAKKRVEEAKQRVAAALRDHPPQETFVVDEKHVADRAARVALVGDIQQRIKKGHEVLRKTREDIEVAQKARNQMNMAMVQTKAWFDSTAKDLNDAEATVTALEHSRCPTCEQTWNDIRKLEEAREAVVGLKKRLIDLQKRLDSHPTEREAANAEVERLRTLEARYQKGLLDLERSMASTAATVREIDQLIESERRAHAMREKAKTDAMVGSLQQAVLQEQLGLKEAEALFRVEDEAARLAGRREAAQKALDAAEAKVAEVQAAVALERAFQAVLGPKGFLGQVVAEILDEISANTNLLLERLPNVSHVTLRFETTTETAAGKTKSTITPVFRAHGHELAAKGWDQDLSGGQAQAVELAVDLAVAQVLGARTGASPGWLILDEPFVGLGREEIEQALEVLRVVAEDRLVVVIDHAPWAQEAFDSVIDIAYENGYSVLADT